MYIVDRIIDDIIVLEKEDETIIEIHKNEVSGQPKDGDILKYRNGKYYISRIETYRRYKQIREKFNKLKNRK